MLTRFRVTLLTGATLLAYAKKAADVFEAVRELEPFQAGPYFIDIREQEDFTSDDMSLPRHYLSNAEGKARFQLTYLMDWKAQTQADIAKLVKTIAAGTRPLLPPLDFEALAADPGVALMETRHAVSAALGPLEVKS